MAPPGLGEPSAGRVDRRFSEPPKADDDRSSSERDRDRLLYSTAFRRLAEVTQVVSRSGGYVFHNRFTHSLKVAQVGRAVATWLLTTDPEAAAAVGGIDPFVVEAAALAHDLGHPPFGHLAESELHALLKAAILRAGRGQQREASVVDAFLRTIGTEVEQPVPSAPALRLVSPPAPSPEALEPPLTA